MMGMATDDDSIHDDNSSEMKNTNKENNNENDNEGTYFNYNYSYDFVPDSTMMAMINTNTINRLAKNKCIQTK